MEPTLALPVLIGLIAIALAFDFLNGLHDAANSIATVVSTRVLSPQLAVMWAAFFNFVAFLFFGLHVAETIGKGIVDPAVIGPAVVFGALFGAICWNVLTWLLGIPSSSSHALVGGLIGAGMAKGGVGVIVSSGVIKTTIAIFASPLLGMLLAVIIVVLSSWLFSPVAARTADTVPIRSATGPTMRKRRWASLRCSCSAPAILVPTSTSLFGSCSLPRRQWVSAH
jgi:inorganic phosphate transporter, PiT family